jgi:hypothetical protein
VSGLTKIAGALVVLLLVLGLGTIAVRSSEPEGPSAAARRVAAAADRLVEARTARMRFRLAGLTGDGIVDVVSGAGQFTLDGQVVVSDGRSLFTVDEDGTRTKRSDAGAEVGSTAYVDLLRGALRGDVEEIGDDQYRIVVRVDDAIAAAPARARPTLTALRQLSSRLEIEVLLDRDGLPVREVVRLPVAEVVIELSDFGIDLPAIVTETGG